MRHTSVLSRELRPAPAPDARQRWVRPRMRRAVVPRKFTKRGRRQRSTPTLRAEVVSRRLNLRAACPRRAMRWRPARGDYRRRLVHALGSGGVAELEEAACASIPLHSFSGPGCRLAVEPWAPFRRVQLATRNSNLVSTKGGTSRRNVLPESSTAQAAHQPRAPNAPARASPVSFRGRPIPPHSLWPVAVSIVVNRECRAAPFARSGPESEARSCPGPVPCYCGRRRKDAPNCHQMLTSLCSAGLPGNGLGGWQNRASSTSHLTPALGCLAARTPGRSFFSGRNNRPPKDGAHSQS